MSEVPVDFPAIDFKSLEGKTIKHIGQAPQCDEGLIIIFEDRSVLLFGFSGCEGYILLNQDTFPEVTR